MRNMIRNLILAPAFVAAAALATTSAMAATLKVPFNFIANGKQCPAGYYIVEKGINGGVVTLASKDGSRSFTWVLQPGEPDPTNAAVVLRFDAEGSTHVLQQVQYGSKVSPTVNGKSRHNEYPQTAIAAGEGR